MGRWAGLGSDDYLAAAEALLPPGAALNRDPGSTTTAFLAGIADAFAALHARSANLSEREADPSQAAELLADWERAFGLPDPCVPAPQTEVMRRAALVARIASQGGQSAAYYIGVASALGFPVTVTEFRPFRVGVNRVADPLLGPNWIFAWRVHAAATTVLQFRAGLGAAGEPLRLWGNSPLECVIRRLAPAHTIVQFAYGS